MARGLKPQQVKMMRHTNGTEVPLMFDRNDLTFFSEFGSKKFMGKTAAEVQAEVMKHISETQEIEWKPVIQVSPITPFQSEHKTFVGIEIDRYYVAMFPDKDWRTLRWDDYNEEPNGMWGETTIGGMRVRRATRHNYGANLEVLPSSTDHRREPVHFLDYDEDVWASLNAIVEGIGRLRGKINDLCGTPDGFRKLKTVGKDIQKLLPA